MKTTLPKRFLANESGWCLRANRLGEPDGSRAYFAAISRLGDGVFWYALMAATGLIALTLYRLLKRWTRRPRPFASDARIRAWVAPLDEFSFPSGHTLHAVAFSVVALAHYPVLAWLLIPFSASVAVSRVVLGLHYPSDVLAATGIGVALASLSLWLVPGVSLFA